MLRHVPDKMIRKKNEILLKWAHQNMSVCTQDGADSLATSESYKQMAWSMIFGQTKASL
jgi:hypothetical protein